MNYPLWVDYALITVGIMLIVFARWYGHRKKATTIQPALGVFDPDAVEAKQTIFTVCAACERRNLSSRITCRHCGVNLSDRHPGRMVC